MANPNKLSKSGRTKFEIENMDWAILTKALEYYEEALEESEEEDFKNSIVTLSFVKDSLKRLKKVFSVKL